jgi:hypothetical protein
MSTPFPEVNEDKRRTQSLDSRRAVIYKRIAEVYDQLGDEFTAKELYGLTKIKSVFANRILVASVLVDSFGCTIIGNSSKRRWKKGNK